MTFNISIIVPLRRAFNPLTSYSHPYAVTGGSADEMQEAVMALSPGNCVALRESESFRIFFEG